MSSTVAIQASNPLDSPILGYAVFVTQRLASGRARGVTLQVPTGTVALMPDQALALSKALARAARGQLMDSDAYPEGFMES